MQQAEDFRAESRAMFDLLDQADVAVFAQPTLFKGWTINAVLQHLHFWNQMAGLQLSDEALLLQRIDFSYAEHAHVQRWADACFARPALARALARG